jgi:large subunit ribosomal protein L13
MKTFLMRKEDVQRRWFELDATEQVLGKLATKAANILMGKEKPTFTPGVDTGDFVVVTNAKNVKATGKKDERKIYRRHSEYVGSMVEETLGAVRGRKPERLIQLAVRRMLPKNTLGAHMLKRLKVYAGKEHPHVAQKPEKVEVPVRGGWILAGDLAARKRPARPAAPSRAAPAAAKKAPLDARTED